MSAFPKVENFSHSFVEKARRVDPAQFSTLWKTISDDGVLPKSGIGFLKKILESGGTLTIQLYLSMAKAEYSTAFGIATVLLVIVLVINWLTKVLSRKLDVTRAE